MRLGVGLFETEPAARMIELACVAEELGYAHAWFGDSQCLWRDPYVTMGATAGVTDHLVLGTGVSNLVTRELSVVADCWLTLNELTGGRVAIGLGTGDSAVRMIDKHPLRIAEMKQRVMDLQTLLAGKPVDRADRKAPAPVFGTPAHVPIYIGASGPKLLRVAGEIADGVILLVGNNPAFIEAAKENIAAGAREAGRTLADIDLVLWTPAAVDDDGALARQLVKSHVARIAMHPLPAELDPESMRAVRELRETYEYSEHMTASARHGELVPDALVPQFAIAGTPAECVEQVRQIASAGVQEIAIIPYARPGVGRDSVIRAMSQVVESGAGRK